MARLRGFCRSKAIATIAHASVARTADKFDPSRGTQALAFSAGGDAGVRALVRGLPAQPAKPGDELVAAPRARHAMPHFGNVVPTGGIELVGHGEGCRLASLIGHHATGPASLHQRESGRLRSCQSRTRLSAPTRLRIVPGERFATSLRSDTHFSHQAKFRSFNFTCPNSPNRRPRMSSSDAECCSRFRYSRISGPSRPPLGVFSGASSINAAGTMPALSCRSHSLDQLRALISSSKLM